MVIRQIGWSASRHGISWSTTAAVRMRFSIVRTTAGYVAADHQEKALQRTSTLCAARSWCGIRACERAVRSADADRRASS